MKAFLETTEWADTEFNCNHVYWMDDSKNKMYAYARFGNPNDTQTFKNPITIDVRGRRFVEVRRDIYKWTDPKDAPSSANPTWRVAGSKGAEYVVEKVDLGKFFLEAHQQEQELLQAELSEQYVKC